MDFVNRWVASSRCSNAVTRYKTYDLVRMIVQRDSFENQDLTFQQLVKAVNAAEEAHADASSRNQGSP
jgi:hypothetical protein